MEKILVVDDEKDIADLIESIGLHSLISTLIESWVGPLFFVGATSQIV